MVIFIGSVPQHLFSVPSSVVKFRKQAALADEGVWSPFLTHVSLLKHQNLVRIHDGIQPVCDGQQRCTRELTTDHLLNESIRVGIHG